MLPSGLTGNARARRRASFAEMLRGEGLEIGALSDPLPIPHATRVVYSDWLSPETLERMYPGSRHPDIVSDSESFPSVADESFDFVVANHVLEHLTDPIRALKEWRRVLRPGGLLMLALPDKRFTFDAPRRRTPLEHLVADHRSTLPPAERNRDHLEEWATHVERLPPGSAERNAWIQDQLARGYAVHNHVWIARDIVDLLLWLGCYSIERVANTSAFTNEFLFLLRRGDAAVAPQDVGNLRRRLLLTDVFVSVAALAKRVLRRVRPHN